MFYRLIHAWQAAGVSYGFINSDMGIPFLSAGSAMAEEPRIRVDKATSFFALLPTLLLSYNLFLSSDGF